MSRKKTNAMILPDDIFNALLEQFHLENQDDYEQINDVSINAIRQANGQLPDIPPFERHPYIVPPQNNNKDYAVLIGTFPPISYLCDSLDLHQLNFNGQNICQPLIPYFHGNEGSLWHYLIPNLDFTTDRNALADQISTWLVNNGLYYTDIIRFCQRKLSNANRYTSRDTDLINIILNDFIINESFQSSNIHRLYFTNSSIVSNDGIQIENNGFVNVGKRDALSLFLRGLQERHYRLSLALPGEQHWLNPHVQAEELRRRFKNKIYFKLKIEFEGQTKYLDIVSSISPAALDRGMTRRNNCVTRFSSVNGIPIKNSATQLLIFCLTCFVDNKLDELIQFNYD